MLLIKPYLGCNLACKYCYEGRFRKKHQPKMNYNLQAILKRMEEFKNSEISLHGGEILCLPKKDVEKLLAKSYELTGKSAIQTNAVLIDDQWIKIFKKYKTHVGISWDGPGELSAYRPGTQKVGSIIEKLVKKDISTSVIIVVSKANAGTRIKLEKLKKYLLKLNKMKISGRLNPCSGTPKYELDLEKLKEVYLDLADFCLHYNLKWSPFTDIIKGLKGEERVCTFMGCDPFATQSAIVVMGDGSLTNCMRTNKEEILLRHPAQYKTRNEILENIEQRYGGCKGCKYWTACYGGCPSSAIDNDWRNRTYLCPVWKSLFEFYEKILNYFDISLAICKSEASTKPCKGYEDSEHGDAHGDSKHGDHTDLEHSDDIHGDAPHGDSHGDSEHGDAHGDSKHGDHTDLEHSDDIHGDAPHGDSHGDIPHGDSHGDSRI